MRQTCVTALLFLCLCCSQTNAVKKKAKPLLPALDLNIKHRPVEKVAIVGNAGEISHELPSAAGFAAGSQDTENGVRAEDVDLPRSSSSGTPVHYDVQTPVNLIFFDVDKTLSVKHLGIGAGKAEFGGDERIEPLKAMLSSLRHKGVKFGLNTRNDASVVVPALEAAGLLPYFEDEALNYFVQQEDPRHPAEAKVDFIMSVAEQYGVPRAAIVFFDDDSSNIYEAKRRFACRAHHVQVPRDLVTHLASLDDRVTPNRARLSTR